MIPFGELFGRLDYSHHSHAGLTGPDNSVVVLMLSGGLVPRQPFR